MRLSVWLLLAGCASPAATGQSDLARAADLALGVGADGGGRDLAAGDGSSACTLGTPDHCGSCVTVCPPGMDSAATLRTCSMGSCDYTCRGEYYDVDGKPANGCEAQDLPLQDTTITAVAVALPDSYTPTADLGAGGNPSNIVSQVYGDSKLHELAPLMRPTGRKDWYRLTVSGGGASDRGLTACLGITNFPADDIFEICLSGKGAATFVPADCKQVTGGGASQCLQQAMAADESGLYYARVRKLSGSWTSAQYALYLEH